MNNTRVVCDMLEESQVGWLTELTYSDLNLPERVSVEQGIHLYLINDYTAAFSLRKKYKSIMELIITI